MSAPGVAAIRSTSSTSARSNWYGKVRPVSSSVSMPIFVVSRGAGRSPDPVVRSDTASSVRARQVLLQQGLDLGQRALLGLAGNVVRAGQRHPGHGRGLDGQRAQVLGL